MHNILGFYVNLQHRFESTKNGEEMHSRCQPHAVIAQRSQRALVCVRASKEFRLAKMAGSHSVSVDASSFIPAPMPAGPGMVQTVLGGIVAAGIALVAVKKATP